MKIIGTQQESHNIDIPSKLGIQDHEFRLVFGRTHIDYDPNKEEENRVKHGYSLESAVYLLGRLLLPISPSPFATREAFKRNDEVRYEHMVVDDAGEVLFMVTTMRMDETVRVISLRRAHSDERALFERLTGYAEPNRKLI